MSKLHGAPPTAKRFSASYLVRHVGNGSVEPFPSGVLERIDTVLWEHQMVNEIRSAIDFYDQHPISAQIILAKLQAERGTLDGLRPDELFPHDQDHYGGLAANDDLAKCAQIDADTKVVDLCAGFGGHARYLAYRYGAFVTGIELTPARVAGAAELTQRVGLSDKVKVIEGDVTTLPLASDSQDAVISQEALLHVAEFARALGDEQSIELIRGLLIRNQPFNAKSICR